jgi:hypothetical protein
VGILRERLEGLAIGCRGSIINPSKGNAMPGKNTELVHDNETYHVQTQDIGPGANYVETTVYKSGRVLSSRRAYYTSFLNSGDLPQRIEKMIQDEHSTVIRDIEQNKFDHL